MGILDFLLPKNINQGVKDYQATEGAVLIDVRTSEEYYEGHIPGSKNIPVDNINIIQDVVIDKATPVFTYCLSGARSGMAVRELKKMGYSNVNNIGGISSYKGTLAR